MRIISRIWLSIDSSGARKPLKFNEMESKKCLIVWGNCQVGFDGATAFIPVRYYIVGELGLKELYRQALKEMEEQPVYEGNSYTWNVGQVQYLKSQTLLLTEGFINR